MGDQRPAQPKSTGSESETGRRCLVVSTCEEFLEEALHRDMITINDVALHHSSSFLG